MTILNLHSENLKPEWCDYYGHLNEAFYLVVFSNATFAFQSHFDLGQDYYKSKGCSLYTVESHIRYLNEVRGNVVMNIETFILGVDKKRIRVGHLMKVEDSIRATFECMLLHFDTNEGKVTPMYDKTILRLKTFELYKLPDWAGSSLGDIRKRFK